MCSEFLLLAAEVMTPEILVRESTASPSGASSQDPTHEFLKGLRPDFVIEEPARVGHEYAEADLERGVTRILLYGEPWNVTIDEETGYPLVRVGDCLVTEDFVRLVEAYNAAMREHARAQRAGH